MRKYSHSIQIFPQLFRLTQANALSFVRKDKGSISQRMRS